MTESNWLRFSGLAADDQQPANSPEPATAALTCTAQCAVKLKAGLCDIWSDCDSERVTRARLAAVLARFDFLG